MNALSKPPFRGIELHCTGYFPICFLDRCEDYGTTLNMFKVSSEFVDNTNILNRPTHVFRNSPAVFELLRQKAIEDKDFIKVEIVEDHSDVGFP
ncbi:MULTISPECIES: hypothetical protein [unclassified Anabaena]|jgi:hypothetical protein|uniref:hypothetical protein n=1 Tax=unclassified Anabaena TaxID=2619674 RepID=UPI0006AC7827|nr:MULTISPECIES: hypothetical protein [unclassified Anabaena]ALB42217.1 hypothetical protein AA650_18735 [Anabaena sp. WA102]